MMNKIKMAMMIGVGAKLVCVGLSAWAVDVPEELEKPEMNEETSLAIRAFATNPCPDTVELIRACVASNYDYVVNRKIAKLHELDGTSGTGTAARDQAVVQEMQDIVDDMIEFKDYRVEQNVIRFCDSRFGRTHGANNAKYNEPDEEGYIPLLGAASDVAIAYTQVTNAAYARFDPAHTYSAGREGHPVVNVSYEEAVRYCQWLTENSPDYAYKYRLPTQEEWELAAGHMPKDASINSGGVTNSTTEVNYFHSVYGDQAVSLSGTLDMWGNVWEWLATNGESEDEAKVKGGSFRTERGDCRTEERGNARAKSGRFDDVGFRLVRTKNHAAAVIKDANSANWLKHNLGRTFAAADYADLEYDSDGDGALDWEEYIALTSPTNANSVFSATITINSDGVPIIGISTPTYQSRTYRTFGKVTLSDPVWIEVNDNTELYRFFKTTVELK